MSMKAHDAFTVPACAFHHAEQHRLGWATFQARYGVDAVAVAMEMARRSPSIVRAAVAAGYDAGRESEA